MGIPKGSLREGILHNVIMVEWKDTLEKNKKLFLVKSFQ